MNERYLKTTIKESTTDSDYVTVELEVNECDRKYLMMAIEAFQEEYGEDAIKFVK